MSGTVRFGIVGCGMIAALHADAIAHIENAELVGVADAYINAAEAFASARGVKAYADYAEMLKDENIDAVCICTPSFLHAKMAIEALEAGKHVAVEKPMALDEESADEVIAAVDRTGKQLTVIYQLRFEEDIIKARELVLSGALGKITLCSLSLNYYRSKEYFSSSLWKGKIEYEGGGALMNQGIHGVDAMEYVVGKVKDARGRIKTLVHNIEVEDTAVATLEFECGALGVITASTCAYPGFGRVLEVYGERGYLKLEENALVRLIIDGEEIPLDKKNQMVCASDPGALSFEMHKKQLENLARAINGEDELVSDARGGKCAVKLINQIYKS